MSGRNLTAPIVVRCTTVADVVELVSRHESCRITVASASPLPGLDVPHSWWPLIDECWDRRVADVVADHLTRDLPPSLHHFTPEAATLLSGALHAASLVNWPVVTLTHLLDSGAVATIIELLGGQDPESALDVASVAGSTCPDAGRVIAAAAIGAQQLHHSESLITGPGSVRSGVLAGPPSDVVAFVDDGSTVAGLVLSRLRYLGSPAVSGTEAA